MQGDGGHEARVLVVERGERLVSQQSARHLLHFHVLADVVHGGALGDLVSDDQHRYLRLFRHGIVLGMLYICDERGGTQRCQQQRHDYPVDPAFHVRTFRFVNIGSAQPINLIVVTPRLGPPGTAPFLVILVKVPWMQLPLLPGAIGH